MNKLDIDLNTIDISETQAQFSHEVVLMSSIFNRTVQGLNLSGGPLAGNVMMAAGLDTIGHTYKFLKSHQHATALAHAVSGPCLQHNLLACLRNSA